MIKLLVPFIEVQDREQHPADAVGEMCSVIGQPRLTDALALSIVAAHPDLARLFSGLPEKEDAPETKKRGNK